jgi:hypothetical protein
MIHNLGQLLQHLATKSGVLANDPNLINVLSNAELTKITLHSDLVRQIDENLLSIDVAKDNHPVLSTHYKSQALNALDKRLLAIVGESNLLNEEELTEFKKPTNSYKKLDTVFEKLKAVKPEPSGDAKPNEALKKQVDELVVKIAEGVKERETLVATHNESLQKVKTGYTFREKLGTRKTILDALSQETRTTSLMAVIDKALQEKDAVLTYDENGNAQLQKKDGTKLLAANNTPISLDDLIDGALATEKLLVVAPEQSTNPTPTPITVPGGNPTVIDGTNQSVADYNLAQLGVN